MEPADPPSSRALTVLEELLHLPLFAGLGDVRLRELAAPGLLHLDSGQALLRRGQSNDRLYVLLEGALQVQLAARPEAPVNIVEAGQCIGEVSIIDNGQVTVDVIADRPCRLLPIDKATFWQLVEESAYWRRKLLELLAERLRNSNDVLHQYERHASVDLLTGLNNRRWLDTNARRLLERCRRGDRPITLLMLDLDHFKGLNDTYGHQVGDQVLAGVAAVLRERLRPEDALARYGGEEFTVLLPGLDQHQGLQAAQRLRRAVASLSLQLPDGRWLPAVTVSIGMAQVWAGESVEQAIARADSALYCAKRLGRNRVEAA